MRKEYPRPDFKRESFITLCGEWDFSFDDKNVGHAEKWFISHAFNKKIIVPFCFESELSGIHDTKFHKHVWYHKKLDTLSFNKDERVILHFEGVDYYSEIFINGYKVSSHYGSCGDNVIDITDYLLDENHLVVYCFDDPEDVSIPRGKQDWEEESHGIWYTRTTGIYKPVWLQVVNEKYVKQFFITSKILNNEVTVDLELSTSNGKIEFNVSNGNDVLSFLFDVKKVKDFYKFNLGESFVDGNYWNVDNPKLFDLEIKLYDENGDLKDRVCTYFGIREVSTKDGYILLNNKPIYQKLVLNQGYYPGGLLTAPSIEDMEKDIDYMIQMGFNGCRIHQKVEDPYFLYLCDKKGFILWQECPAHYGYTTLGHRRLMNEWIEIIKNNYNHPSIITYTPLNESWGVEGIMENADIQRFANSLYYLVKSLDSTRLVISNDGWEHCKTDLITVHNYSHGEKGDKAKYDLFVKVLSEREEIIKAGNEFKNILVSKEYDEGQPIILSEFGGIAFKKDTDKKAWGYTTCQDEQEYQEELERIYLAISKSNCIQGICYTQLTDVEQEVNGLLTFDRKFKIDPSIIKKINEMLDRK